MQHVDKTAETATDGPKGRPAAEPTTARAAPSIFADHRPEATAQRERQDMVAHSPRVAAQRALSSGFQRSPRMVAQRQELSRAFGEAMRPPNHTGLPDGLKAGVESLSGMSLDHVKVHYNSSQPAQLNALAYAQGSDIHIAPGQERHLPHEAWHVVQQAQGRVNPTAQTKAGVSINDDAGLEHEADVMGRQADARPAQLVRSGTNVTQPVRHPTLSGGIVQKTDKVINYGSGTSPETLMKTENEHVNDINVINVDSGHMLLAEVIEMCLKNDQQKAIGDIEADLLMAYEASTRKKSNWQDLVASAKKGDLGWMKHHYFDKVIGFEGVIGQVKKMGAMAQEIFGKKSEELRATAPFSLGDASRLTQDGSADTIYCINGYGYSPLTDKAIFIPMAAALKAHGELIIISELMGPTASPFLGFSRANRATLESLFVLEREEEVITEDPNPTATMNIINKRIVRHVLTDNQPLLHAFALVRKPPVEVPAMQLFKFEPSVSTIYLTKSDALGHDPLTTTMQSRHTEGGGELAENIHVRLVFSKK